METQTSKKISYHIESQDIFVCPSIVVQWNHESVQYKEADHLYYLFKSIGLEVLCKAHVETAEK